MVLRMKTTENAGHETFLLLLSMARGGDQAICQGKSALIKGFWLGVWATIPSRHCLSGPIGGRNPGRKDVVLLYTTTAVCLAFLVQP